MRRAPVFLALLLSAAALNAATFTVTTTADSGPGSFRQAVLDANASTGADTIAFAIGTGAATIVTTSNLPTATESLTIDGTTQPGYAGTPLITVYGAPDTLSFVINGGNSTVRAVSFLQMQVRVETGDGNMFRGNMFRSALDRCAFVLATSNNVIGGTTTGDGNTFDGNSVSGACISGSNNTFKGNRVVGNRFGGIGVGGSSNVIGGAETGARNIISGNGGTGLTLSGTQHTVKGNYVGVGADGTSANGNGRGTQTGNMAGIAVSGTGHVIGGLEAGAGNVIAHNFDPGVDFTDNAASGVAILSNSIYKNSRKGIDLTHPTSVTPLPNDELDADTGANGLQNYPQICSVVQSGQNIVISGRLHSTPNMQFVIQFFSTDPLLESCQAQTLLGSINVVTNANGDAPFTTAVPGSASALITSTATDANNNTSEISPCVRCVASSDFNGDGNSDIFWRNTNTGENTFWFLNGRTIIGGGNIPSAPPEWTPYLGDFNADGRTDIFWRNATTGGNGLWYLNGRVVSGGGNIASMAPEWVPLPGDFTGDSKWDLLWRNTATGDQVLWGAHTFPPAFEVLGIAPGSAPGDWQRRAGTMSGDSRFDIFWRNPPTGENAFWFMNGRSVIGGGNLPPIPNDWTPTFGDSNGDGRADILWRNSNTGEITFWFLSGGSIIGGGNLPPVGAPWLVNRGDYNGDGRLDIFWRSPVDGENTLWLLNGRSIIGGGNIPDVPGTAWVVIGQN
jgi:hypothetical protein